MQECEAPRGRAEALGRRIRDERDPLSSHREPALDAVEERALSLAERAAMDLRARMMLEKLVGLRAGKEAEGGTSRRWQGLHWVDALSTFSRQGLRRAI